MKCQQTETRKQRTLRPKADPKLTLSVALRESERCRRYPDPVLNEQVIVVLSDAVLSLLDFAKRYASECCECNYGNGATGKTSEGEPCEECSDIRELIAKAEGQS